MNNSKTSMRDVTIATVATILFSAPGVCANPSEVVREATIAWRSSELRGGILIGSVTRLSTSKEGVLAYDRQLDSAVFIDRDGESVSVIDVTGEAPGTLPMVVDVDASDDGSRLAAISLLPPARAMVRDSFDEPYEVVLDDAVPRDADGFWFGVSLRVGEEGLITYRVRQLTPTSPGKTGEISILDYSSGERTSHLSEYWTHGGPLDGVGSWVWDAGAGDVVYVGQDYYSGRVRAIAPDGTELFSAIVPAAEIKKSEEVIARIRRSYEQNATLPGAQMPRIIETYPILIDISADHDSDVIRVSTSEGLGRGAASVKDLHWWVLDATNGTVLSRVSIEIPDGEWAVSRLAWTDGAVYVLAADMSRSGEPEIVRIELRD